ncbi:Chemocyanin [Apostasia shenzhenica]|uniref:Chemocyanin n=1 Tax=Apostasia shenzhenica TaxID=1088818 RepID=A0A2I0BAQ4_9ASPA|nr:Chemocyanin [Apostasia shenzhenica]
MAQGRSTAVEARAACLALLLLLLLKGETVESRIYTVGGHSGWKISAIDAIAKWADDVQRNNTIRIDDKLYFKYTPGQANVAVVTGEAYNRCVLNPGALVYEEGSNTISLSRENNYFISTLNDGCSKGLKLGIKAL